MSKTGDEEIKRRELDAIIAHDASVGLPGGRRLEPPYPWCVGNPFLIDCIKAGYCRRDPNCGE